VRTSVNHKGDSDSTGAVTGNIGAIDRYNKQIITVRYIYGVVKKCGKRVLSSLLSVILIMNSSILFAADGKYYYDDSMCWWWLRSPGYGSSDASLISFYGDIAGGSDTTGWGFGAVRPVMWINFSA